MRWRRKRTRTRCGTRRPRLNPRRRINTRHLRRHRNRRNARLSNRSKSFLSYLHTPGLHRCRRHSSTHVPVPRVNIRSRNRAEPHWARVETPAGDTGRGSRRHGARGLSGMRCARFAPRQRCAQFLVGSRCAQFGGLQTITSANLAKSGDFLSHRPLVSLQEHQVVWSPPNRGAGWAKGPPAK